MSGNPSTSSCSTGGSSGGPCGACKFLRRKCVAECIFAPYFSSEQGATQFAAIHKVFGASNVTKLLLQIPMNKRLDAVITICYEAQARIRDPVYGCVAQIFALQQQVANLRAELSYLQAHLATLETVAPPPPPPPPPRVVVPPTILSITDLPTTTCMGIAYDLSSLFDPPSSSIMHPRQFSGGTGIGTTIAPPPDMPTTQADGGAGDGDHLQEQDKFVTVSCREDEIV